MPTTTFRVRPVHSWSETDEVSLVQVLNSIGYEVHESTDSNSTIRRFESQKVLKHDLWAESNEILVSLIPRLHCLFKFELKDDGARVWRWTQIPGQLWFDPNDEGF